MICFRKMKKVPPIEYKQERLFIFAFLFHHDETAIRKEPFYYSEPH